MHIVSYTNYYPFGMAQVGRNWSSGGYRFGYNGKEKDDEIKGSGNSVDFGARMLDTRVARWMKLDALSSSYPSFSPYNYTLNNPIVNIDPDGNVVQGANRKGKELLEEFNLKVFSVGQINERGYRDLIEECRVFSVDENGKVVCDEGLFNEWMGVGENSKWTRQQQAVAIDWREIVKSQEYVARVLSFTQKIASLDRNDEATLGGQTVTLGEAMDNDKKKKYKIQDDYGKCFTFFKDGHPLDRKVSWILINEFKIGEDFHEVIAIKEGKDKFSPVAVLGHETLDHFKYLLSGNRRARPATDLDSVTDFVEGGDPVGYQRLIETILGEKPRTGCFHTPKGENCDKSH